MSKQYIGDSVYVEVRPYEVILTTENGLPTDPSNTIVLEQSTLKNLFDYVNFVYHRTGRNEPLKEN